MKNIIKFILASLIVFVLITPELHAQKGYTITGKIKGLPEGQVMTLNLWTNPGIHTWNFNPDSTVVKNGEFHFSGIVPDAGSGPRRYWLAWIFHTKQYYFNRLIELWITNGENITVSTVDDFMKINHSNITHYVDIQGSPSTFSRLCLQPVYDMYFQNIIFLNNKIKKAKDSIGFNASYTEGLINAKNELNKVLYLNVFDLEPTANIDPEVLKSRMCFLQLFEHSGHASFWAGLYKGLSEEDKNTYHGRWFKAIAALSVGQAFPEFNLPMADGKNMALKDVVSKSKITIVHFWSGGSGDRKYWQDELRVLYKKYHDKGLNLVGLFFDDEHFWRKKYQTADVMGQFKDMVKSENFPWPNVIDPKGADGPVEKIYREADHNDTKNVVLDAEGKIIAWDVRGAELQYYLWKAFGE